MQEIVSRLFDVRDVLESYEKRTRELLDKVKNLDLGPVFMTSAFLQCLLPVSDWILSGESVLILGPTGSGKQTLIDIALKTLSLSNSPVIEVDCHEGTSPLSVIEKLQSVYSKTTIKDKTILRRRDRKKVILILKAIDVSKEDKYNTIRFHEFVRHLISHGTFWSASTGFTLVENFQVIVTASQNPDCTMSRFFSQFRVTLLRSPNFVDLENLCENTCSRLFPQHLLTAIRQNGIPKMITEVYLSLVSLREDPDAVNVRAFLDWIGRSARYPLSSMQDLRKALAHEFQRVFCDRQETKIDLRSTQAVFTDTFGSSSVPKTLQFCCEADMENEILWVPVLKDTGEIQEINLQKLRFREYKEVVQRQLQLFTRTVSDLPVFICPQVLGYIHRLGHSIGFLNRSILLTGTFSLGRKNLVRFVSHWYGYEFHTPSLVHGFGAAHFGSFLKEVVVNAGVKEKRVCLFLEEYQIVEETILNMVNDLLSHGEVPGLFTPEEWKAHAVTLRNKEVSNRGDACQALASNVRNNLQVVISFACDSIQLKKRLRSNPMLQRKCEILHLSPWGEETSLMMVKCLLKVCETDCSNDVSLDGTAKRLIRIHYSNQENQTNRSLISFAKLFAQIFKKKKTEIQNRLEFLNSGFKKLQDAEQQIDELSEQTQAQRSLLETKQNESEESLEKIASLMTLASERKLQTETLTRQLQLDETALTQRKESVLQKLADVQPMVDEAKQAVGQIKSDNLNEIRSLKMPPTAIRDVLEGVLTVLGQRDMTWNNMRRFLSNRGVKDQIMNFDPRSMSNETSRQVKKLLEEKAVSFEDSVIHRVSIAAAPLASWVKANFAFKTVLESIEPLENELNTLSSSLSQLKSELIASTTDLQSLDEETQRIKADFQRKTGEVESVRSALQQTEGTLQTAQNLIGKLKDEKDRWEHQVFGLNQHEALLEQHSLLAAAFITYLSSNLHAERTRQLTEWCRWEEIENFHFTGFMSSISLLDVQQFSDQATIESALCLVNTVQWPMIVDPNNQVMHWLPGIFNFKGKELEIRKMSDLKLSSALEMAARFGKTLLIENAEKIDPVCIDTLRARGLRNSIMIGSKKVELHEDFRLMLSASHTEYLTPQTKDLVTVVNFTITDSDLEEQLLDLTINRFHPDLNTKRREIFGQQTSQKKELNVLEKNILDSLVESTGNLLENTDLISSLDDAKSRSLTLQSNLENLDQLQANFEKERGKYRPAAQRATALFFGLSKLKALDPSYQYGVGALMLVYQRALQQSETSLTLPTDSDREISAINKAFMKLFYSYISLSIARIDWLPFALLFVKCAFPSLSTGQNDWDLIIDVLRQEGMDSTPSEASQGVAGWIPKERTHAFSELHLKLPELVLHCEDFRDSGIWRCWIQSASPETCFPSEFRLNPLQRLTLISIFCPQRVPRMVDAFLNDMLEPRISYSTQILTPELHAQHPVLFLITPGTDPSQELSSFARSAVGDSNFSAISMSSDQLEESLEAIRNHGLQSKWILVKNVHLSREFICHLDQDFSDWEKTERFQLFMTTESIEDFPNTLLQSCTKIKLETKPGLKENMIQCLDAYQNTNGALGLVQKDLLRNADEIAALVAWLHSIIQCRKELGSWNGEYEFSLADFRIAVKLVLSCLTRPHDLAQWKKARCLLQTVVYGSVMDDLQDREGLEAYLHLVLNPSCVNCSGGEVQEPLYGTRIFLDSQGAMKNILNLTERIPEKGEELAILGLPLNTNCTARSNSVFDAFRKLKSLIVE